MVKMTLAEVFLVLNNKESELDDVLRMRVESLVNVFKKNNGTKELTHPEHEFKVDDLTVRINKLYAEIRKLRLVIMSANLKTIVEFTVDGVKISLQEAIVLVKQYRAEQEREKMMGDMKVKSQIIDPTPRFVQQTSVDKSYEQVTEPNFDVKAYRKSAEKLEVLITKLEVAINQANYGTEVEIDGVEIKEAEIKEAE